MQEQLFDFLPNPFPGQFRQVQTAAEGLGLRCDAESEPPREPHRPQHPQGILGESRAHMPQQACCKIALPPVGVQQHLSLEVVSHRVDGEIAAGGRLIESHGGIGCHPEPLVPFADIALPSGNAYVISGIFRGQFKHAEVTANRMHRPERQQDFLQAPHGKLEDFQVIVLRAGQPKQPVPHPSSHQIGHAAVFDDRLADAAHLRVYLEMACRGIGGGMNVHLYLYLRVHPPRQFARPIIFLRGTAIGGAGIEGAGAGVDRFPIDFPSSS